MSVFNILLQFITNEFKNIQALTISPMSAHIIRSIFLDMLISKTFTNQK